MQFQKCPAGKEGRVISGQIFDIISFDKVDMVLTKCFLMLSL